MKLNAISERHSMLSFFSSVSFSQEPACWPPYAISTVSQLENIVNYRFIEFDLIDGFIFLTQSTNNTFKNDRFFFFVGI